MENTKGLSKVYVEVREKKIYMGEREREGNHLREIEREEKYFLNFNTWGNDYVFRRKV